MSVKNQRGHSHSYLKVHGGQAFDGGTTFIVLENLTGKAQVQFWPEFLRYSDCQEVLELAKSELKGTNHAVYEDIPKELHNLRKAT